MVRLPLTVEYALLGFLRQGPLHGYEIYRRLGDPAGLGLVWRLKQSQLYALLAKLEDAGYATAAVEPQAARPPRKVFELTRSGRKAFLDWVQSPVPHGREVRLHFLAKLYFARREGVEVTMRLIEQQRAACHGWLADYQARSNAPGDVQSYAWLVRQFRVAQIEAMLGWLDECQQVTTSVPPPENFIHLAQKETR
jgi:DNA-binding PadR family transcriptional regulator